jgi:nucleoside-diphosphate-sugar epimerase
MHVFVAGATGVLGRALIPSLIEAGHQVSGLARTAEKMLAVNALKANPERGDVLDAGGMSRLLQQLHPDIVVNVATAMPLRLKIDPKDWIQNDRIRTVGTSNLLGASESAGVTLFIQESVGYVCESQGAQWITEDTPRSDNPFLKATVEMEDRVRAARTPGVLLRLGALMSADSWHTRQSVAGLRRGMLPIIGDGSAYLSLIHADDAASAIVNTIAHADVAAGRTYNIADGSPAHMAEVFRFAASALNAPAPKSVPPFLARMAVGSLTVDILGASYRMSADRAKADLGFKPQYPTYRETWLQIANALKNTEIAFSL